MFFRKFEPRASHSARDLNDAKGSRPTDQTQHVIHPLSLNPPSCSFFLSFIFISPIPFFSKTRHCIYQLFPSNPRRFRFRRSTYHAGSWASYIISNCPLCGELEMIFHGSTFSIASLVLLEQSQDRIRCYRTKTIMNSEDSKSQQT